MPVSPSTKVERFRKRLAWAYSITLLGVLIVLFDAIHSAEPSQLRSLGVFLTLAGSSFQMWATFSHARQP
jgi:hypothetical protein